MARVTVEDCLRNQQNRFDLTLEAATRARTLELGQDEAQVPLDNDKPTVVALREIAEGIEFDENGKVPREEIEEEDEGGEGGAGAFGGLMGGSDDLLGGGGTILPGF